MPGCVILAMEPYISESGAVRKAVVPDPRMPEPSRELYLWSCQWELRRQESANGNTTLVMCQSELRIWAQSLTCRVEVALPLH